MDMEQTNGVKSSDWDSLLLRSEELLKQVSSGRATLEGRERLFALLVYVTHPQYLYT